MLIDAALARETILVVDDVPANVMVLQGLLRVDYDTVAAVDGQEALEAARGTRVDLVLLDVMLPGIDGFEVYRRFRTIPGCADVPVIFVTALDATSDEARGLALGAADYVTKPYNLDIVLLRVRNHLNLKRQRDQIARQAADMRRQKEGLEAAFARVRTLEGILSICMYCKRIRDDDPSVWKRLEVYLAEHTDAKLSHGICPDCRERAKKELIG
jgi:CheY-like chemotaxis protein